MLMFLMAMMCLNESGVIRVETEQYKPIRRAMIAVSGDRIWVGDHDECRITGYDATGNEVVSFGSKGAGPGEFPILVRVRAHGDNVYAFDFENIHVFDNKGAFIEKIPQGNLPTNLVPAGGGWVYGTWNYSEDPSIEGYPGAVMWVDHRLENKKTVLDMSGGKEDTTGINNYVDLRKPFPYNPTGDRPELIHSADGTVIWFRHRWPQLKIDILDAKTGKVRRTIKNTDKPLPFNTDWGEEQMKTAADTPNAKKFNIKYKAAFPDTFPSSRDLFSVDNLLYVIRWTGTPEKEPGLLVYDSSGKQVQSPFTANAAMRLLAAIGDHLVISTYDNEEEVAGFAICPRKQAAGFIKNNPIEYESKGAGGIMVLE